MTDQFVKISYWSVSKNIFYSFLFVLPMLFLYEIMCWVQFFELNIEIRNGADVFFRELFNGFGKYSEAIYGFVLIIIFTLVMINNRQVIKNGKLKFSFLIFMLIESLVWCFGFVIIMGVSEHILLSILERNIIPEQFYLAIGAGIWEELLFRVGAIGSIFFFFKLIIGYSGVFAALISVLISACIFSLFHYIGNFGDVFTFKSFLIRSLAGVFLGSLYIVRGFGITAYTHIFYDMTVISLPVIFD